MSKSEASINPTTDENGLNHSPGSNSLAEILSQPQCWRTCLSQLAAEHTISSIPSLFLGRKEFLFIGCGSSYYVGLSAAATMSAFTGWRARAIPASEILLYPDLTLTAKDDIIPVLISRSGRTSEVVRAAETLKSRGFPTLAISCTPNQPLQALATTTILLPAADEKSTVMTRSFTSMLLALQALAAFVGKNQRFTSALEQLPSQAIQAFSNLPDRIKSFTDAHDISDYVYLAQGPFYGIACEGALKVTEMSVSYAQAFHTLEFRHGPKSIVSPETLLVFLLSQTGFQAELEALEEMKSLGATIVAITTQATAEVRRSSDLVIELPIDLPEAALLAPYLYPAQLIGLYAGLKKGLDPDTPRNLSRSVILDKSEANV